MRNHSKVRYKMKSARNGERGIRSILYALYQSPCTIPFSCKKQTFKESDGSKTSLTLIDGKVTLEHKKSKKQDQNQTTKNDDTVRIGEEEEEKDDDENVKDNDNEKNNNEDNDDEINNKEGNNNENNEKINQDESKDDDDDSFEYITSAAGEAPQYDLSIFVVDEKIQGDCPKDLSSKLLKIYKHVYRSLLNLYDLPLTKLSLHFGVNDKGEIADDEKKEKDEDEKEKDEDEKEKENGELENQLDQINGVLLSKDNQPEKESEDPVDNNNENKDQNQEETNDGPLEEQVNDNVNGLLNSPEKDKKEESPHSYEIFLLEDSMCVTSTQTVGPEDDEEDIDAKFGEFFSEEIKTKIDYDHCYVGLPDCGIPNYKTPRSMCILLKAHKRFPKASCAHLHDLIQPRFEQFNEEEAPKDETGRNSYSTDLNGSNDYTTDSNSYNFREYNNPTKTIIDYDLYNVKKEISRGRTAREKAEKPKKTIKSDTQSTDTDNTDNTEKTSELNDTKVFVCVRCWHLISSINYVALLQHEEMPPLHTLPPRPFQCLVHSEQYDKRHYPMGYTGSKSKPFSFMINVENSPYKKKVPEPRKPPQPQPLQPIKRPKTALTVSSSSQKSQDVFARLLSNTWSAQRNDPGAERQYKVSKGYRRPKTPQVKMIVYPENPAALRSVKKSYGRAPFDINLLDPKRKRRIHPTNGELEDFSYRIGGRGESSGRKAGDDRPDFVI